MVGVADHVGVGVRVGEGVQVACVGVIVGVRVGGAVIGAGVFEGVDVPVWVAVAVLDGVGVVVTVDRISDHSTAPTEKMLLGFPKKSVGILSSPAT